MKIIIKKYSCNDCTHNKVCLYQEDMIKLWEDLERQDMGNSNIIINHDQLLFPYVASFGLECKYFRKDYIK